jgi:hypothetical protein
MAKIFTSCLVTGQRLDTGIEIDESSFERLPSLIAKVFCPHCNIEHGWTKDRAWVEDGDKPKR